MTANKSSFLKSFFALAISALLGYRPAEARVVIDVGGFESGAGYSTATGDLAGQVPGATLPNGEWEAIGSGTGTAVVQDTTFAPGGGTQAVEVSTGGFSAPTDGDFWAIFLVDPMDRPTEPLVTIEWDMLVDPATGPTDPDPGVDDFGPIFGFNAFDESGGFVSQLASLVVDSNSGEVLYQAAGTGFLTTIDDGMGGAVTVSGWNTFAIILDFDNGTYDYALNGSVLGTEGFIDAPLSGQLSDADIVALPGGANPGSLALTGTAYFDNFTVTAIPEPSAIVVLGAVFAPALTRRRR